MFIRCRLPDAAQEHLYWFHPNREMKLLREAAARAPDSQRAIQSCSGVVEKLEAGSGDFLPAPTVTPRRRFAAVSL